MGFADQVSARAPEVRMAGMQKKRFEQSTDVRPFKEGKGELRVVDLEDKAVGMATFEAGWRWSEHVKPIAGTDSCQSHHTGYVISGHMTVRMNDCTGVTHRTISSTALGISSGRSRSI